MNRTSTTFLKISVILIGLPILVLCLFAVPKIADFSAVLYPDMYFIKYLVLMIMYGAAIPFYFALYQAFKLLGFIDGNDAFSEKAVKSLHTIKYCAIAISIIYTSGMPVLYLMAERDDAPGIIVIGAGIIFASIVIAVFAALLQKLLQNAIDIKSENDLTV